MSYCAVENTASAMRQVNEILEDGYSELNEYEQRNLPLLAEYCVDFINNMFGHLSEEELVELLLNGDIRAEVKKILAEG